MGDIWAAEDKLWCEFEAQVFKHTLHTVYYCRRCDFSEEKKFDPEDIHKRGVKE